MREGTLVWAMCGAEAAMISQASRTTRIDRAGDYRTVCAFSLIEVLVVVAVIALLISILLPSLARAREMARRTTCASNGHQMGLGLTLYGIEHKYFY